MSVESVRLHLKKYNLEDKLMKEPTTCKTVVEAAETLGCHESDIAKTMSFDVDSKTVIIVMAGDKKVDNAKYKAYFHKKAKMLSFDEVLDKTSHYPGGVTPYGLPLDIDVYLDESLKEHDILYPAGGDTDWVIKLTREELEKSLPNAIYIDVTK